MQFGLRWCQACCLTFILQTIPVCFICHHSIEVPHATVTQDLHVAKFNSFCILINISQCGLFRIHWLDSLASKELVLWGCSLTLTTYILPTLTEPWASSLLMPHTSHLWYIFSRGFKYHLYAISQVNFFLPDLLLNSRLRYPTASCLWNINMCKPKVLI